MNKKNTGGLDKGERESLEEAGVCLGGRSKPRAALGSRGSCSALSSPPCWGQKAVSMGQEQGQRGLQEVGEGQKGLVEGAHGLRRGRAGGELWIRMVVVPGAAQGCTSPLGEALPVSLSEVLGIYQRKALGSEKPTKY